MPLLLVGFPATDGRETTDQTFTTGETFEETRRKLERKTSHEEVLCQWGKSEVPNGFCGGSSRGSKLFSREIDY